MPRITVGNQEIVVVFKHGTGVINPNSSYSGKKPKLTDYTQCVVLIGEVGTRDENKTTIGDKTVYRNPKDTPNLVVARRTAFEAASNKLSTEQSGAVLDVLRPVKFKPILPKPPANPFTVEV